MRAGQSGKAEKAARRALELAGTPEVGVRAFNALGLALMAGSVLEAYLEEHELAGYQAWDGEGRMQSLFQVGSFPTYVVVGPEGRVLYRTHGWSNRVSRSLGGEVRRAVKGAKKR